MSSTSWPCEDEAQNYMQKHKIVELLDNLTAQVVFHRPDNPKEFMINQLVQLKDAKSTKKGYPCLFDDGNINAMFCLMDPEGRGFISSAQFTEAMHTLGITNFTPKAEADRVTLDMFSREAKRGLLQLSATVGPG